MNRTMGMKIGIAGLLLALGTTSVVAQQPGKAQFDRMDADGDGKITREEIDAHAAARFSAADADGDGFLTPEELRAEASARHKQRVTRMIERFDKDGSNSLDAAELEAAGEARMDRMHARRAGRMFERMDADKDGKLGMEEMHGRHGPSRMFDRLDANDDDVLTREEFADRGRHGMRRFRGDDDAQTGGDDADTGAEDDNGDDGAAD